VRLAILWFAVQAGPEGATAGAIQAHVDLPASTLSHHLKRLVDTGVMRTRGEGTFHYYSADCEALRKLSAYLVDGAVPLARPLAAGRRRS
jgi:ArsR family transcriptional regulator